MNLEASNLSNEGNDVSNMDRGWAGICVKFLHSGVKKIADNTQILSGGEKRPVDKRQSRDYGGYRFDVIRCYLNL